MAEEDFISRTRPEFQPSDSPGVPSGEAPDLSVIVPTYAEAGNLEPLTRRLAQALQTAGLSWELIVANDESGDDTALVCARLSERHPVRLLNRTKNRGLALAVAEAAPMARGASVAVMDADLSHPPEKLAEMVALLNSGEADIVVGSRNAPGAATDEQWPFLRRVNSWGATLLARPLTSVRDPMAGYFAMRLADWPAAGLLAPVGFKILLEIIVRGRFASDRIREVPIFFADRKIGWSKMGLKEQANYLRHLLRLYLFRWPTPVSLALFCMVGCCGFVVDIAGYFLAQSAGANHVLARALSFWPATFCNWLLNRTLSFAHRKRTRKLPQAAAYAAVTVGGFMVNFGTYAFLSSAAGPLTDHKVAALVAGVLAGLVFNFVCSDRIVFKESGDNVNGSSQHRPKSSS